MKELISKIRECEPVKMGSYYKYDEAKVENVSELIATFCFENDYYEFLDQDVSINNLKEKSKIMLINGKGKEIIAYLQSF